MTNFFELFGIAPAFDIDPAALETAYFQQQRLYHPDRFVGKPAADRQQALQRSVDINQGYQILKNPLSRAQYLLKLQGIAVGTESDSVKPTPALLMETMEWREEALEADEKQLDSLDSKLTALYSQALQTLSNAFLSKHWDVMAHETLRLGYLIKTQEEIARRRHVMKKAL